MTDPPARTRTEVGRGVGGAALVGRKWTPEILMVLRETDARFGALQQRLPALSHKVLVQQLRALQAQAVVERIRDPDARVSRYRLTVSGRRLARLVRLMLEWDRRRRGSLENDPH